MFLFLMLKSFDSGIVAKECPLMIGLAPLQNQKVEPHGKINGEAK
jgi:hypothetical protein